MLAGSAIAVGGAERLLALVTLARIAYTKILACVSLDDPLHERVSNDIVRPELDELDARYALEHSHDVLETRFTTTR